MVVAGIPGIQRGAVSGLNWREVTIEIDDSIMVSLMVSEEKVRYYSNDFRGVLVKADALLGDL